MVSTGYEEEELMEEVIAGQLTSRIHTNRRRVSRGIRRETCPGLATSLHMCRIYSTNLVSSARQFAQYQHTL
jgi:hypothetical protein